MRTVLYAVILVLLVFLPARPVNVGELEPIQAVWLSEENGNIVLQTDTEDKGFGATVAEALDHMRQSSTGIVYLDTAQFLLVSQKLAGRIGEIKPYLKDSVKICLWEGETDVKTAAEYMQAHKIGCSLREWEPKVKLPKLPPEKQQN